MKNFFSKQILTFIAVVEQGSFTKAAMQLGTTQPNVTIHIRNLEEAFGHKLINRDTISVSLTDEGIELQSVVSKMINASEKLSFSNESPDQDQFLLQELTPSARESALNNLREALTEELLLEVYPQGEIKFDRFGKPL